MIVPVSQFAPVIARHGRLYRIHFQKSQRNSMALYDWLIEPTRLSYVSSGTDRSLPIGMVTRKNFKKRQVFYLVDRHETLACKLTFAEILGVIEYTEDTEAKNLREAKWIVP